MDRLALARTPPAKERADAARNRKVVLEAAAALFREHGVDGVSMDAIAARAGVGKGTLFRRFGDKAGLAAALLDEQERALQEAILFGPAPLGPDGTATAAERLRSFVDAYLDYVLSHLDLVRMSETASPGARYRIGAYDFWHQHVALLLASSDGSVVPHGSLAADASLVAGPSLVADPDADAHTLLASLAAEHVHAMLPVLGPDRLRRSIVASFCGKSA